MGWMILLGDEETGTKTGKGARENLFSNFQDALGGGRVVPEGGYKRKE